MDDFYNRFVQVGDQNTKTPGNHLYAQGDEVDLNVMGRRRRERSRRRQPSRMSATVRTIRREGQNNDTGNRTNDVATG